MGIRNYHANAPYLRWRDIIRDRRMLDYIQVKDIYGGRVMSFDNKGQFPYSYTT